MKRIAVTSYWLAFSLGLLVFTLNKPILNWDMIPYVAASRMLQSDDLFEVHRTVFEDLRDYVSAREFSNLTASNKYREAVAGSPEALGQQLPHVSNKVLYTLSLRVLETLGMNAFYATHFISAVSYVVGLWVLLFAFRGRIHWYFEYLLPLAAIAFGVVELSRLSTPDGLGFLTLCIAAFLLLRGGSALEIVEAGSEVDRVQLPRDRPVRLRAKDTRSETAAGQELVSL